MPKLHLAYLVEDVEYPRPEELQASNEELPHSSRVKRQSSPLAVNNQDVEAGEEKTSAPAGRNAALSAAILRVLEVANAKPTPVEHTGSYSGRRRRSAQQGQTASSDTSEDVETFETVSPATPGRNAALSAAILRVLEVANAKPTPVELSGSYSGKKKRSAQQVQTGSNSASEDVESFETASATPGRNAALSAAILRVLEVANAKPTPVELSGSYSGKKKRSAQQGQTASSDASEDVETFETASETPRRNAALSAAILRVLEVAGAKPTPVELSGSYSGKKKRSAQLEPTHSNAHQYGLIEPKIDLVKVKSHGNFGKVVQASVVAPSAHAKLEHGKRRKRSENLDFDFIPFNVYDDRRVKLLKVEENDFHALPRVIDASNKKKRADVEKQPEEAKVHVVQLTADQ